MRHLDHRARPPLPGRAQILRPQALGERLDGRHQGAPAGAVEDAGDVEHAARLADAQEALLPVLFDLVIEAVGVDHVAGVLFQPAQVLDRALAGLANPPLFIDVGPQVLPQPGTEAADHRRRLVADLAFPNRLPDARHRLQLLAHPQPLRRRRTGEPASAPHPGVGSLALEQVVPTLYASTNNLAE